MVLLVNKWVTFTAGVFLMAVSGSLYLFGTYSDDLKSKLNYSQEQINLVGTLSNVGTWAGIFGGLYYDSYGPRSTALLGGLMMFAGYFVAFLMLNNSLNGYESIGLLSAAMAVMGQGSSWTYTTALNTSTINFPQKYRGTVVGVLVSFFALCNGLLTLPYASFYQPDVRGFFLFLAVLTLFVSLLGAACSTFTPPDTAEQPSIMSFSTRARILYGYAVVVAVYIGVAGFVERRYSSHSAKTGITVGVFLLMLLVCLLPVGTGRLWWTAHHWKDAETAAPLLHDAAAPASEEDPAAPSAKPAATNRELNLVQTVKTLDFWLLALSFSMVVGSGVTVVGNLGNFNKALGGSASDKDALAMLFSVFDAFGRMLFGVLSDRHRSSRALFATISAAVMCASMLFLAFSSVKLLYVGVVMLGLAYGGTFCVVPVLTSELFGTEHFGANFGAVGFGPSLGSYLLSTRLAGGIYDSHAHRVFEDGQWKKTCDGNKCYHLSLLINTAVCAVAVLLSVWLARRVSKKGVAPSPHVSFH